MRIVMLGTGGFAVPTCCGLLESEHRVLSVVTRPPRSAARRSRSSTVKNPMRELAERHGLMLHMPDDINSPHGLSLLQQSQADLLVVCDYGQILSSAALATVRLGGINLHASLLPKYRGAAPINWALYHGETKTGVTVIHMTPKLDAGPCLIQEGVEIDPQEDALQLEDRLATLGSRTVRKAIEQLARWDGQSQLGDIQNSTQVSRAPRLKKTDGAVDWSRTARQLFDQVRAFKPWPGSYTGMPRRTGPLRLLLDQVKVEQPDGEWGVPGTILLADPQGAQVACGEGTLTLLEVQPAGKRKMRIDEFLRGYPLVPGQSLV